MVFELETSLSKYLTAARICRIATTGPDGPHVAPFCPAYDGSSTLYVETRPTVRTAANLGHDPRAIVLVDDYVEDWGKLKLLSVAGKGRALTEQSGPEFQEAVHLLKQKFAQLNQVGMAVDFVIAIDLRAVRRAEGTG